MPKFMTYQRPIPVNKANWSGKPGGHPYQPIRKVKAATKPAKSTLPNGLKPH
jgi:hypothetical protein